MNHKKILPLLVVAALMPLASVIAITQFRGTPVENTISGIAVLTVYAFMFASYLARFAVAVLGVFAIYKVLWERVNGGKMGNSEA